MSSRKPPENKARVNVTVRLPQWIVTWLDATAKLSGSRTEMIEHAIRKTFKLKEPK